MNTVLKVLTVIFVLIVNNQVQSQDKSSQPGKFGFGVSDLTDSHSQNMVLTERYWINNDLAFDPGFGFISGGQDVFVLSGGLLKSIGGGDRVYPYFGGKLIFFNGNRQDDDTVSLVPVFGAEFYLTKRFSLIGESQMVINFKDDSVRTQAVLSVLFYLN